MRLSLIFLLGCIINNGLKFKYIKQYIQLLKRGSIKYIINDTINDIKFLYEHKKDYNDIKELGIPNVCFSLVDRLPITDNRLIGYKLQRINQGFDNTELWNLDYTISSFILPRLIKFRYYSIGITPGNIETNDEWIDILDSMINAFRLIVESDSKILSEVQYDSIYFGLGLFKRYFLYLNL